MSSGEKNYQMWGFQTVLLCCLWIWDICHRKWGDIKRESHHSFLTRGQLQSFAQAHWQGKTSQEMRWEVRKSWGLWLHIIGGYNPGLLFTVKLLIRLTTGKSSAAVGSNQILAPPKSGQVLASSRPTTTLLPDIQSQGPSVPELLPEPSESADPLWSMIINTSQILNASQPKLATSC